MSHQTMIAHGSLAAVKTDRIIFSICGNFSIRACCLRWEWLNQLVAEAHQADMARAEAERALRADFEAFDEAGKEARFQAWCAGR